MKPIDTPLRTGAGRDAAQIRRRQSSWLFLGLCGLLGGQALLAARFPFLAAIVFLPVVAAAWWLSMYVAGRRQEDVLGEDVLKEDAAQAGFLGDKGQGEGKARLDELIKTLRAALQGFLDHITRSSAISMRLVYRMHGMKAGIDKIVHVVREIDQDLTSTNLRQANEVGTGLELVAREVKELAAQAAVARDAFGGRLDGMQTERPV